MTTQVSERISACQTCRERQRNRCRLANQIVTVLARMPGAECPMGRWPNTNKNHQQPKAKAIPLPKASSPTVYLQTKPRAIVRLAAVTCHYNPCGYKLLEDNYHRFSKALPSDLDLWTIELAYGDVTFRLPEGPRMLRVRGDFRHVLWQKERLLNLAIDALPSDVDAVAWLDADLIWLNRNWVEEAQQLLERYNAVQLFEHVVDTDREGRLSQKSPSHVYARIHGLGYGRPGGAWAARREAISSGLYDRHAIGGGDSAMLCAWEGRTKLSESLRLGTAWETHYRAWAARSYEQVQKSLACVPGEVIHLYHGTRQNRQYVERYKILHENTYDPIRDVEIDPETGLLQWSAAARERKPDLVRRVAQYFALRREDE